MTKSIGEIFLEEIVGKIDDLFPEPPKKEASNTTGGTFEGEDCCEKEACNTTGGSIETGEILNPAIEAQRVLAKAEAAADEVSEPEVKAAALLEVARAHSQVGAQLLSDFDF